MMYPSIASDWHEELEPEQVASAATGTSLTVDVLSAGGGPTLSRHVRGRAGWSLDVAEFGCHVRAVGAMDRDTLAVVFVTEGSDATICRTPMHRATVLVIPGGAEISASIRPGLRYVTALVPLACWQRIDATATGRDPVDLRHPVAVSLPGGLSIDADRLVGGAADAADDCPPAMSDFLGRVAQALGDDGRPPPEDDRRARHNRIRQAFAVADFVEAHLGEPMSTERLCRTVGASRRQLEYAVRSVFGLSPRAFVEHARLNEFRRRLLGARGDGQSVTDLALEVGLTHMGRTAAGYRRLFGELPSTTHRGGR